MARLPAIVASFLVGTIGRHVALLVAIVAKPHVARWQARSGAIPGNVAGLPACVTDAFVGAFVGQVAGLLAVPAQGLRRALCSNVPWKSTVVADCDVHAFSSIVSRLFAVFAEFRSTETPAIVPSVWSIAM